MGVSAGRDLLLKYETTLGGGSYSTLGGLQAKTFTLESSVIEITNHGSNEYREILDGAGVKSMKVSGSGIYNADSATLENLETAMMSGTMRNFHVIDTSTSGRTYQALFKIASFERGGEHNGAQNYSISLESSGTITIT